MIEWFKANYSVKSLFKNVIFCTINFAIPLWYLVAMVENYVFWYIIVKHQKEYMFVKLIPLLFIIRILLTTICETNNFDWFWKVNFVTQALPWFLFGYYVHDNEAKIIGNKSDEFYMITSIIGCIVALIPTLFDLPIKFTCVGIIFYATSLFILAIRNPNKTICKRIVFIGDRLSLNVYILHVPISEVFKRVIMHVSKVSVEEGLLSWLFPIITLIISIMCSAILNYYKNNVNNLVVV